MKYLLAFFAFVLLSEVSFRIGYRLKKGYFYRPVPKVPWKGMYMRAHPYLPYIYRRHATLQDKMPARYPLHRDRGYFFEALKTNNLGFTDGPDGGRAVAIPKPPGRCRIACLGASSVANYISDGVRTYSWPLLLEQKLREARPDLDIEVNNFSIGGWTSAEMLINYLLTGHDLEPDVVVIYHAYKDLEPSLTPGFVSDYSHSRRNLGESLYLYRWLSFWPDIPFWHLYKFILAQYGHQNIRMDLLRTIQVAQPDFEGPFRGTPIYKRNIEYILKVCRAESRRVVLSTYVYHLYDAIKDSPRHLKYRDGVDLENTAMRELAASCGYPLVDIANSYPRDERYFLDAVHFTPEGMEVLAQQFLEPILAQLKEP
jgi:lysophospholipase L1-like esterase